MSDFEASRIALTESATEANSNPGGGPSSDVPSRPRDVVATPGGGVQFLGTSYSERVVQRWWNAHVCGPCTDPNESPTDCREMRWCRGRVFARAHELHAAWVRRASAVYQTVARLSRSLAGVSGRKSILIVSEELFEDTTLQLSIREAIDASQRANTAIYFLGARGLAGDPLNVAESRNAARPQDVGRISHEQGVLATAAGAALADETGGAALTNTNDLAAGLTRMASDSSAYYLLGYQPEQPPDGRWHKLEVKVLRGDVEVRARRGYLASRPEDLARAERRGTLPAAGGGARREAGKRPLVPTLLAGSSRQGLPLRVAAYVLDPNDQGAARVRVAVEVDNGRVQVDRSERPWKATLDLTIMATGLFRPPVVPVDERLSLSLEENAVGTGWWLMSREIWLPPGLSQIRVFVRDVASGLSGLVSERVTVPDLEQPYLSTPVLTTRTASQTQPGGEPPRLVPATHRQFARKEQLFCQYEVFNFGGGALPGVAEVFGGYALKGADGSTVQLAPPTRIDTEGGYAVRRLALPLSPLAPGPYVLELTVEDRLAGRTLVARAPFAVTEEPEASEATPD